ncbi:MAG: ATP-NAD kinase family protein [Candidatus Methanomethylicia archaeon]|jgi:predicted polyphosphate/ATP-dependent NAD kinase|nr:ATP-NAD kinase family protein [Candidatus Methanomethylicia archaeon]
MRKVGFIINPIAGMGGAVGLKGTDGEEILEKAIKLGAEKVALKRAEEFLKSLGSLANTIEFWTCPGEMGEDIFNKLNINHKLIPGKRGKTTAEDTKFAAKYMLESNLDIIVFCGGDGTARDILDIIDMKVPVIGVPAGVKMQSGVFAINPRVAAELLIKYLWGELPLKEAEVADVDEESYRAGRLSTKLYGYLLTPYEPDYIQGMKTPTPIRDDIIENMEAIAKWIIENMEDDTIYILGPGTTVKKILELLGLDGTLLGVDLLLNRRILKKDVNEKEILEFIRDNKAKIIVSPIGKQGFIFGRGNQQISPKVIKMVGKENIIIISTKEKLKDIKFLRVDTGDIEVDKMFANGVKVLIDYGLFRVMKVKVF